MSGAWSMLGAPHVLRGVPTTVLVRVAEVNAALVGRALDAGADGAAFDGTPADVNARILCAVMVETPAGLARVREIAASPGVGMIFVGPFDLSLALGIPVDDLIADTSADGPLQRIVRACSDAGIAAGVFAGTPERAMELVAHGFTVVAVATDLLVLERGGASLLGPTARASD